MNHHTVNKSLHCWLFCLSSSFTLNHCKATFPQRSCYPVLAFYRLKNANVQMSLIQIQNDAFSQQNLQIWAVVIFKIVYRSVILRVMQSKLGRLKLDQLALFSFTGTHVHITPSLYLLHSSEQTEYWNQNRIPVQLTTLCTQENEDGKQKPNTEVAQKK